MTLCIETLETVRQTAERCTACDLHRERSHVVFSRGNPKAKVMFIGEAPGENEDLTGLPFVGRAGKLLDQLLVDAGFDPENDIYVCNIVKCRPPNNRVPLPAERLACQGFLEAQIRLVHPKLLVLVGATALKQCLGLTGISKYRGQFFTTPDGRQAMPVLHPSYLLRKHSQEEGSPRWLTHQDLRMIYQTFCSDAR